MQKRPFKIQISDDVEKALHQIGEYHGITGNVVVAAAAAQLARVPASDLWHALGRIASEGAPALPTSAPAIDGQKHRSKRTLLTVS